jgi:hypothetical protein
MARIPVPTIQRQIDPGVRQSGVRAAYVPPTGVRDIGDALAGGAELLARSARAEDERRMKQAEELEAQQERTRVNSTLAQATLDWTQSEIERRQSFDASTGASYVAPLLKDFDSYVEKTAKGAKTERERELLKARLESLRSNVGQAGMVFEAGARSSFAKKTVADTLDKRTSTAMLDPSQTLDLLAQQAAEINGSIHLTPDDRRTLMEAARERITGAAATTMADRDPRGFLSALGFGTTKVGKDGKPVPINAQEAADRVSRHPVLSQVPPNVLRAVTDRARAQVVHLDAQAEAERERQARRAEIAADKRERESNQAYTILSQWAREGIAADPAAAKPLLDKIAGTPYAAAYAEQAKQVAGRASAAMLPLPEQRAQLDQLISQRNKSGTSPALETEIDARTKILGAAEKAYREDPLRAGAERGLLPGVAPLDTSTIDAVVSSLGARVEQAATVQGQAGRPVSPLTTEEASRVGDMLRALPPAEQGKRIAQLSASMQPGQAQQLARQIEAKDRALALSFAAGASMTTQGRTVAELIAQGAQKMRDAKEPAAGSRGDLIRQQLREEITEYVGDAVSGRARQDIIDAAIYINAGLDAVGSNNGAERAVRLAVGGDIVERHGRKLPVPAGVDLDEALSRVSPDQVLRQAPDGVVYLPGGQAISALDLVARLPDAQLEPAGLGRYAVRSSGGLVVNAQRRPVLIEVR